MQTVFFFKRKKPFNINNFFSDLNSNKKKIKLIVSKH